MRSRLHLALILLVAAVGCRHQESGSTVPVLDAREVARLVPDKVADRQGWADDVVSAIRLLGKDVTEERACAIIAVVDQESGFQANPAVANLAAIVRRGLRDKLAPLGPLAGPALAAILRGKAPGTEATFGERINKLRTERDLDRLFRDLKKAYQGQMPGRFAVASALSHLLRKGSLDDWNPVTTAGSMQVKVSFARELGRSEGLDDEEVREILYTRGGGVRFGTARLIGYPAAYEDVLYRFADYNAGMYASRNAQLQTMLAGLTGITLVPDGDLLAYDRNGDARRSDTSSMKALIQFGATHGLSERAVRRDVKNEKSQAFEETELYHAVRSAWTAQHGLAPPYARVPDVTLLSPKLSRPRTTLWFATSVKQRYDACRMR